jgi:diguanylate cyclase (GGDEF)-like protein/PAS domain S-box-containing protein
MRVISCLATEHNLALVALAAVICSLGALTSIRLLIRARDRDQGSATAWVFLGGVAAGSSVWCTHFTAMLAFDSPVPVGYDPGLTALSLLVVIVASLVAFAAAAQHVPFAAVAGGAVFGLGVATMHYVGMAAFSVDAVVQWDPAHVGGSLAWSVAVSALAFQLASNHAKPWHSRAAVGALVLAIVGLHFTGMAAMVILPYAVLPGGASSEIAREMLAFGVSGVGLLVVGIVWVSHFADVRMNDQASARLRHLVESAVDGMVVERDGRVIEINAAFAMLSGRERTTVLGMPVEDIGLKAEEIGEGAIVRTVLPIVNGEDVPVEAVAHRETGALGDTGFKVYALRDIRPRLEQERKIADLARLDTLTGLPNRMSFLEHLDRAIDTAGLDSRVALIAIDLNRFKEVNDLYGHAAGDTVLATLATRMKAVLRPGELLARLGGDEFVALQSSSDRERALGLANRLERVLYSLVTLDLSEVSCGGSLGIAMYPSHASNGTMLLNNADLAMYRAKGSPTDAICFYEEEMDEAMRARRRMVQQLRDAIALSEFELRYQVQVSAESESVTGYEVLLRWKHPERGYVPPTEFIPIAEESGLILQIGEWVLREACREAASWKDPHKIAVNLSAVQLGQPNLPELLSNILAETALDPTRLEVEITETSLMLDMQRTVNTLGQIKALGISIALDDFGTGYSSLSTLRAFPFNKIKLDKSFVDDVETDSQARAVMLAVMALGEGLGIPVLAEGVETSEQFFFVRNSGCREVQGFLFGRPSPTIDAPAVREAVA